MHDNVLGAPGEHAFGFEGHGGVLACGFVRDSHGTDGFDVFLARDDVTQEAGGRREAEAVSCRVQNNPHATLGNQLGGFAPKFLCRHGGLDKRPGFGVGLAGHANGVVRHLFCDETEATVFADELEGLAEHRIKGLADGTLFDAGGGEVGDGEGGDVEEAVDAGFGGVSGFVEEGGVFELFGGTLEEGEGLVGGDGHGDGREVLANVFAEEADEAWWADCWRGHSGPSLNGL